MPVYAVLQGAVQTAYISYISYDLSMVTLPLQLTWPTSYQDSSQVVAAYMEFINSMSIANPQVQLPDATEVSVGQNFIVSNLGSQTMYLLNFGGTQIDSIGPSIQKYFILTDNSTSAGTWKSLTFGAGTSSATASQLTGYGLNNFTIGTNDGTELNTEIATTVLMSTISMYQVLPTDYTSLIIWTSGSGNIYLPETPTGVPAFYYVSINNAGTGVVTIYPNTADVGTGIQGLGSISLNPQQTVTLVSTGTAQAIVGGTPSKWFTLGLGHTGTGGTVTSVGLTSSTGLTTNLVPVTTAGNLTVDLPVATAIGQVLQVLTVTPSQTVTWNSLALVGTATLGSGGTVTVAVPSIQTDSQVLVTRNTPAGTIGDLSVPSASITPNTSFIINSSQALDTSTVNWYVVL